MSKLLTLFYKHRVTVVTPLIVIIALILGFQLNEVHSRFYIIAKFEESGPLSKHMPVYYKGYNIGETERVELAPDYKHTMVKIIIYPREPKIPEYTIAKVKKLTPEKNYVALINPDPTTKTTLKKGSVIDGDPAFDMEAMLSDISNSGLLIPLIQNFSDTALSLNKTSTEIKSFFSDSRLILRDNKQNLNQTTKNLAQTTKSFKKLASRVNNSITNEILDNTISNVDKSSTNILSSSENVKNITTNIECATRNFDNTMAKLDSTLTEANGVAKNANVISGGLCNAMGKRFAGMRLMFGKPLDNSKCPKNCSK